MANIQSAKKRMRQNEKRRVHNRVFRTSARSRVKHVRELITAGKFDEAEQAMAVAYKALDKAAQKGIIHKNNAARRKSRLMQALAKAKAAA